MSQYKDFFAKHKKALASGNIKKSSTTRNHKDYNHDSSDSDYSPVHDSSEFEDDNFESMAYGKSSDYYGKGDYEYRDYGQFGSTPLEDEC